MQKKPKPVLFDDLDLRHQCEQVLSYIMYFKDNSIRKRPTNLLKNGHLGAEWTISELDTHNFFYQH